MPCGAVRCGAVRCGAVRDSGDSGGGSYEGCASTVSFDIVVATPSHEGVDSSLNMTLLCRANDSLNMTWLCRVNMTWSTLRCSRSDAHIPTPQQSADSCYQNRRHARLYDADAHGLPGRGGSGGFPLLGGGVGEACACSRDICGGNAATAEPEPTCLIGDANRPFSGSAAEPAASSTATTETFAISSELATTWHTTTRSANTEIESTGRRWASDSVGDQRRVPSDSVSIHTKQSERYASQPFLADGKPDRHTNLVTAVAAHHARCFELQYTGDVIVVRAIRWRF